MQVIRRRARDWGRIARRLVIGMMAYNALEGVIAMAAGIAAASVALVAFGLDSYLELAAAAALLMVPWLIHEGREGLSSD